MTAYSFPDLSGLVSPQSVAIVGASDRRDRIGGRVFYNLVEESNFTGRLHLVNPGRDAVDGRPCVANPALLPEAPELAVIAIPAEGVLDALRGCADRGTRFAIVLTSGFGETGDAGKAAEAEMRDIVRRTGMRIYGPNCPGLSNVNGRLGFTFSPAFKLDLRAGPLGVATQGGGLGRTVLQSMDRGVGVGLWCSAGNEVDLEVSDFIHYMADAPDITVIATLIEGIRDGAKFVAAVRRAAEKGKPVVALKVGRSDYGAKAAMSHTAAISGSAAVNSAAFRQLGVVEVDDIDELVDTAWLLSRKRPGPDERVAVYCSSGGTAALTADMVGTAGLTLSGFDANTDATLRALLPAFASVANPVDTTAEVLADMTVIDRTLAAVAADPGVGLVLHPFPMEYGAATTRAAESVIAVQAASDTPLLPIWISDRVGDGYRALADAGLAPVRSVGKAVTAVRRWAEHGRWLAARDPDWVPVGNPGLVPDGLRTRAMSELEAKAWLRDHGIDVMPAFVATTLDEARNVADAMGYPVVAKIASVDILHKSDVGGVALGLVDADAVAGAWRRIMAAVARQRPDAAVDGLLIERMAPAGGVEMLVGVNRDPVFGPVMTCGLGGIHVEIFQDVARRLLPLTPREAAAMLREVRAFALLDGARGRPKCDVAALERLLVSVSDFICAQGEAIEELDLNPVWVGPGGALPLDAVIVLRQSEGLP